ncbi:MAG: sigma-54 dependent transcriptional regulator [Desulfobacteraceae bacterium]|jgi:DNA-binding NtrC family response regulator
MTPFSLFVVDDEDTAREGITLALMKHYTVSGYGTAEEALAAIPEERPDLILLDIGLPGMNGIQALEIIKKDFPELLVIMITAYEDVQTVVSAMKLGAYDYIVKPLDMNSLIITVRNALETIALKKEIQLLQEKYLAKNLPVIVGDSRPIKEILEIVSIVSQSIDTPVLILGETGSGKELIAQTIHYQSPQFKGPMVTVNCAAIPKELIESELFGYEKGAFSGADAAGKAGLVEEAANGTLFLDEVGDLSAEAQAKLLRFLESGEYFRVGGTRKHNVKTRIVSATNKDLFKLAQEDKFRLDLYYRLAVVKLFVPSLNQRREDILPLARFFLDKFTKKFGKSFTGFTSEAVEAIQNFNWTGNIRELRNLIERAVLLSSGTLLDLNQLGIESTQATVLDITPAQNDDGIPKLTPKLTKEGIDLPDIIRNIEKTYFEQAIALASGNVSKAAKLLNLSRDKFRYRLQKL